MYPRVLFDIPQPLSSNSPPPRQILPDAPEQVIGASHKAYNPLFPSKATSTHILCPICGNQSMSSVSRYSESHRNTQTNRPSSPRIYKHSCLIPGCRQYFTRTDYRCNHLKKKHRLPIPKGCWAHTWLSKEENHHHFQAAVIKQELENAQSSR